MPSLGSNVIHPETPRSSVGIGGGQVSGEDFSNFQQTFVVMNEAFLSRINAEKKLTDIQYKDVCGQLAGHSQELKVHSERIDGHDKELKTVRHEVAEQGRVQSEVTKSAHKTNARVAYLFSKLNLDSPASADTEIGK